MESCSSSSPGTPANSASNPSATPAVQGHGRGMEALKSLVWINDTHAESILHCHIMSPGINYRRPDYANEL